MWRSVETAGILLAGATTAPFADWMLVLLGLKKSQGEVLVTYRVLTEVGEIYNRVSVACVWLWILSPLEIVLKKLPQLKFDLLCFLLWTTESEKKSSSPGGIAPRGPHGTGREPLG
jgi:hypothetical protein